MREYILFIVAILLCVAVPICFTQAFYYRIWEPKKEKQEFLCLILSTIGLILLIILTKIW